MWGAIEEPLIYISSIWKTAKLDGYQNEVGKIKQTCHAANGN